MSESRFDRLDTLQQERWELDRAVMNSTNTLQLAKAECAINEWVRANGTELLTLESEFNCAS